MSDDEYSDLSDNDDVTLNEVRGSYSLDKYDPRTMFGEGDEDSKKYSCEYCGRKFLWDSLERHKFPCYRDQEKKRKLQEKEAAKSVMTDAQREHMEKMKERRRRRVRSWKAQHIEFISAVQAARAYTRAKELGEPVPDIVPCGVSSAELVSCDTCARRFNVMALKKHAPRCKEENARRMKGQRFMVGGCNSPRPQPPSSCGSLTPQSSYSNSRASTPRASLQGAAGSGTNSPLPRKVGTPLPTTSRGTPTPNKQKADVDFNRYVQDQVNAFKEQEREWRREQQQRNSTPTIDSRNVASPRGCYSRESRPNSNASLSHVRSQPELKSMRQTPVPAPTKSATPSPSGQNLVDVQLLLQNPALLQQLSLLAQTQQTTVLPGLQTGVITVQPMSNLPPPPPNLTLMSATRGDVPQVSHSSASDLKSAPQAMPTPPRQNAAFATPRGCAESRAVSSPNQSASTQSQSQTSSGTNVSKFCHECGMKFPTFAMKFCSKCGTKRPCMAC